MTIKDKYPKQKPFRRKRKGPT